MAVNRIKSKLVNDEQLIDVLQIKNIKCSSITLQELFNLLPKYFRENGLTELLIDRLPTGIVIDDRALKHLLRLTNNLKKLSFRHLEAINKESLQNVILKIANILLAEPPNLTELDFCRLGGSDEEGLEILEAIYETDLKIKRFNISENPTWAQSPDYAGKLSIFFSKQEELEAINLSYNQEQASQVKPVIESLRSSPSTSTSLKSVALEGVKWST